MAVPKAVYSLVKVVLVSVVPRHPADDPAALRQKEVHAIFAAKRFRWHRWKPQGEFFCFTVVIDPLKRLLGGDTNRVVGLRELYNCRQIKRGWVDIPADPDPDYFFQNLDAYIAIASSIKHHALPTSVFTGTRFDNYTKVYRTKGIRKLAADLSEQVGDEVTVPHFNFSEKPTTLNDLKPETHKALKARLTPEYEHLSEYYDSPFEKNAS